MKSVAYHSKKWQSGDYSADLFNTFQIVVAIKRKDSVTMAPLKIQTKDMIIYIIFVIVGCSVTFSHSTAISVTGNTHSNNNADFDGNGILRDGDDIQDTGLAAAVKSYKKPLSRSNDDSRINGLNDNEAHSALHISDKTNILYAFDENDDADDKANDFISIEIDDQLSMLTKQMTRKFQHELKAAIRKTTKDILKADFESQLEQLRWVVEPTELIINYSMDYTENAPMLCLILSRVVKEPQTWNCLQN